MPFRSTVHTQQGDSTWEEAPVGQVYVNMYLHVDADRGVVDCERYSVLNIFLDLC